MNSVEKNPQHLLHLYINTISRCWQKMDGSWVDIDLSCVEVGTGEVDLLQGNNCQGNQVRIHE